MRPLEEIRKDIDSIDTQIRDLLMKRLDCSEQVIASKIEAGNYAIYRADREASMLEKLGEAVPENRRAGYLAVVRKVIETSRMYQYGFLYEQVGELFQNLIKEIQLPEKSEKVIIRLTRPNIPNSMSEILSMIGDYGYNMDQMDIVHYSEDKTEVRFELKILGDIQEVYMQKLLLQISMESKDFVIVEAI